jgi:large subunit ribosomal protein L4
MTTINVYNADGAQTGTIELDPKRLDKAVRRGLLKEALIAHLASQRQGTHKNKNRGEVAGGGKKPWRQKGTGRARAGSTRSPIFTGGGAVFGPHPRSYTFKVNRKERRAALRSALSLHAGRGSLAILDAAAFEEPSTKTAAALLADWGQPRGGTLVVVTGEERGAGLSFRNIDRVAVLAPSSVGVADIVGASSMLCSAAALAELTARALGAKADSQEAQD